MSSLEAVSAIKRKVALWLIRPHGAPSHDEALWSDLRPCHEALWSDFRTHRATRVRAKGRLT
jgi:hypothetical protein